MKRLPFIITESDRLSILSMHNLINEDTNKIITFSGVALKGSDNTPFSNVLVIIIEQKKGKPVNDTSARTLTDLEGKFTVSGEIDPTKKYYIKFSPQEEDVENFKPFTYDITDLENQTQNNLSITLESKIKSLDPITVGSSTKIVTLLNFSVLNEKGELVPNVKLNLLYNGTELTYTDFLGNPVTKISKDGNFNNLLINDNTYPDFKSEDKASCSKKLPITAIIDYYGIKTSATTEVCNYNVILTLKDGNIDTSKEPKYRLNVLNKTQVSIKTTKTKTITVQDNQKNKLSDVEIKIYSDENKTNLIGTVKTNSDGVANITLSGEKLSSENVYLEAYNSGYGKATQKINFNDLNNIKITLTKKIIRVRVYDIETDEMVGPGQVEIYADQNKNKLIGVVKIKDNGVGVSNIGDDFNGDLIITDQIEKISTMSNKKQDVYAYSFEKGYDEFFKKFRLNVTDDLSVVTLDIPIKYFDVQDDDVNTNEIPSKKSTRKFIYGESNRKTNSKDESIEDARRNALQYFVSKNKKFYQLNYLYDLTPPGGEVIYLHNYDDGSYRTIVKFKRRELKKFVKEFVKQYTPKEPEPVKLKEINFTNMSLDEALEQSKYGDKFMVFALSENGSSSLKLVEDIKKNEMFRNKLENDYKLIKVTNNTSDKNYQLAIDDYNLPGFPSVFILQDGVIKRYFKNDRGEIYLQLLDYLKK
jgi:acylphosphatase